uniref:Uncharacterized protein n=1 Tax=Cacopsylla melanoneura TaxID=428564 RepID=A0A8D9BIH1_9HEMI
MVIKQQEIEIKPKEIEIKQKENESKARIKMERTRQTTPSTSQIVTNHCASNGNLAKIELTKFDADVAKFFEFLECFTALIDRRTDLKPNEKFHYLKTIGIGSVSKLH